MKSVLPPKGMSTEAWLKMRKEGVRITDAVLRGSVLRVLAVEPLGKLANEDVGSLYELREDADLYQR